MELISKKLLPFGWSRTVAERTGYSMNMVQQVRIGNKKNNKILEEILKVSKEFAIKERLRKENLKQEIQAIENLYNELVENENTVCLN